MLLIRSTIDKCFPENYIETINNHVIINELITKFLDKKI